jgi:hypothetical protein
MGLGKTVSCLTAIGDLFESFDAQRALVVAPLRVARDVWTDEVNEWAHLRGLRVAHVGGTPKERILALQTPADIWTIGRENVMWLERLFIKDNKQIRQWPWDVVILDEAQSFKAQSSKRWKSMRRLRRFASRLIQLTGTPVPNGYGDLWAQIYLLDGGQRLGRTEKQYKERFFNPPQYGHFGKWTLKPFADEQIQKLLSDIVLVINVDEALGEMTPVRYNPVRVHLDVDTLRAYKRFERAAITEFGGSMVKAVNAAVLAGKLLQFANGSLYTDDKGSYRVVHDRKIEALGDILDGVSGKALIAYEFIADKTRIMAELAKQDRPWGLIERREDYEAWMRGDLDFLLLHPASAGHGLNLQIEGAETIVWFGLTPNLEHYLQLNARLIGGHRRAGKHVIVHHIIAADTRDEEMMDLLTAKGITQDDLTRCVAMWQRS